MEDRLRGREVEDFGGTGATHHGWVWNYLFMTRLTSGNCSGDLQMIIGLNELNFVLESGGKG